MMQPSQRWIALSFLLTLACFFNSAQAWNWPDWWLTKDQQAEALMKKNRFQEAQQFFIRRDWKATASYRANDFQQAAALYQTLNTAEGYYNQGNALAKQHQYKEAIAAYTQALSLNSQLLDAKFNRDLLKKLLEKEASKQAKQQQPSDANQEQQSKQTTPQNDPVEKNSNDQKQTSQPTNQPNESKPEPNSKKESNETPGAPQQKQPAEQAAVKKTPDTKAQQEFNRLKQQWFHLIPDDPGGLLREKFLRDYRRRQQGW